MYNLNIIFYISGRISEVMGKDRKERGRSRKRGSHKRRKHSSSPSPEKYRKYGRHSHRYRRDSTSEYSTDSSSCTSSDESERVAAGLKRKRSIVTSGESSILEAKGEM